MRPMLETEEEAAPAVEAMVNTHKILDPHYTFTKTDKSDDVIEELLRDDDEEDEQADKSDDDIEELLRDDDEEDEQSTSDNNNFNS